MRKENLSLKTELVMNAQKTLILTKQQDNACKIHAVTLNILWRTADASHALLVSIHG
jgi:hypothetical protein